MRGLRVGIIGGGLGGLAAALALRETGQEPVVFERTEQFRPAGAGISIWPNGVKVLCLLGLGDRLAESSSRIDHMCYADADGRVLTEFALEPLYAATGQWARPIARAELQGVLAAAVGPESVQLGRSCVKVSSEQSTAVAWFSDGSSFECDLLVAADGIHSKIRPWVAGHPVERQYVGYVNFNTIIAEDEFLCATHLWKTWAGGGKRVSVMPIGRGAAYVFFDIPMPAEEAANPVLSAVEELEKSFGDWADPIGGIIDRLDAARLNRVLIHELPMVAPWFRDRVVLMGDAVHAMAPDLGQGGCQALEDAWVLAHYLATTDRSVTDALRRYQEERAPRTAEIVRRARKRSDLTHAVDPAATAAWYRSLDGDSGQGTIAGLIESVVTGPCR